MTYLQLTFSLNKTEFPLIESILDQAGALSITSMDAEDKPILEPEPGETPLWQEMIVTALFQANKNKSKVQNRLRATLGNARLESLNWQLLAEQDWERAWLKDYEPIQFGTHLWVGPQDFTPPTDIQASLVLDPGLAFGTGSHPTTYLCLEWLSAQNLQHKTLLDFGCGSGILALAALKLGAATITGIDIDPQALLASAENAARNGIDPTRCRWLLAADAAAFQVDILLANILATPLIDLAPLLLEHLAPGGMIILAGILVEQAEAVKSAYTPMIDWQEAKNKEGWTCLVGKQRERL